MRIKVKHRKFEIAKNVIWGIGTAGFSALTVYIGNNIMGDEPHTAARIFILAIAAVGGAVGGFIAMAAFLRKL